MTGIAFGFASRASAFDNLVWKPMSLSVVALSLSLLTELQVVQRRAKKAGRPRDDQGQTISFVRCSGSPGLKITKCAKCSG